MKFTLVSATLLVFLSSATANTAQRCQNDYWKDNAPDWQDIDGYFCWDYAPEDCRVSAQWANSQGCTASMVCPECNPSAPRSAGEVVEEVTTELRGRAKENTGRADKTQQCQNQYWAPNAPDWQDKDGYFCWDYDAEACMVSHQWANSQGCCASMVCPECGH